MILYHALFATAMLLLLGEGQCRDPCLRMRCPYGQFCVSIVPPCPMFTCPRVGICVSSVSQAICPPVDCLVPCPTGLVRKYDSAGCPTCKCYDPCKGVRCPLNQECAVRANDKCVQAVCVDRLMCFGWTEPHYDTFDGAGIDFQGVGLYVMSQLTRTVDSKRCAGLRDFQVLVDQEYRGSFRGASYIRSVTLVLPGIVTIHIGRNRRMTVISGAIPAGMRITTVVVPAVQPWWMRTVMVLRIETDFGLVVQYDGDMWASVYLPVSYRYCVEGLCGNADFNPRNDYINRIGLDTGRLPVNRKFWSLGNSWRVVDPLPPVNPGVGLGTADLSQFRLRRSVAMDDGAEAEIARYEMAPLTGKEQSVDMKDLSCTKDMMPTVEELCGVIINEKGPFAECIKRMPARAKAIYNGCKYDVCANWDDMELAKSLAQSSIGTFVAICAGNGLITQAKEI